MVLTSNNPTKLWLILLAVFVFETAYSQTFYPQASNLSLEGTIGGHSLVSGGGISCADFNNDGYDDLSFATGRDSSLIFYINSKDSFTRVDPPYVNNTFETTQILWVDYDNDDDKDLFVASYLGPDLLYENDGNFGFTDVTSQVGLDINHDRTYGVTFGDLDLDGDLDIYKTIYGDLAVGGENILYEYDSATGQYTDITLSSGTSNGMRQSYAAVFFDFDRDGDLDIYVANDRYVFENTLYMNMGNMFFIDVSVPSNTNLNFHSMTATVGDPNMDGWFDIYSTDCQKSEFLENQGNLTFLPKASTNGTTFDRYGWGANFFDYDNDKDADLYVSHAWPLTIGNVNAFYVNDGNANFSEPFLQSNGLAGVDVDTSFCNAILDYNNDGNLDIVINKEHYKNFELFTNHTDNANNFFKIKLEGVDSNLNGVGAMIEVYNANDTIYYISHTSQSYLAQNSDYFNIGIGTYNSIDSLKIMWPYQGSEQIIYGTELEMKKLNTIKEGVGVTESEILAICKFNHYVSHNPIPSQTYGAVNILQTANMIETNANVVFRAENLINLQEGFEVKLGAEFLAEINGCQN